MGSTHYSAEPVQNEVQKLQLEGRYTFAGWFPVAARLIESAHNAKLSAPVQAVEPQRPDILEKLTYHALERDDLTLDDCLAYLAKGWYDVRGRTERQMVLQLTALLAAAPPLPKGWA